jgi:tRNA splicing endonuclease
MSRLSSIVKKEAYFAVLHEDIHYIKIERIFDEKYK